MSGIGRNTLLNVAGASVPVLLSLLVVPLYLQRIGEERYGALAIVWMLLGFFGAFDLGLGKVMAHQIAKCRENERGLSETFWTVLSLNALLGTLGAGVLLIFGNLLLGQVLKIPQSLRAEVFGTLPWLVLAVPMTTLSSVLVGALEGWEWFGMTNKLGVMGNIFSQVLPLAIATWISLDLSLLVASVVLVRLTTGVLLPFLACLRRSPSLLRPRIDFSKLGAIFRYGSWLSVTWLIGPLLVTADRFLIGSQVGAAAVGHYSIPANLVGRLQILPEGLARSLFPRFSILQKEKAETLARDALLSMTALITPIVCFAMVILPPFLQRWIGMKLGSLTAPIGCVILLGIWVNSLAFIPYTALQGQGRPDLTAKFHLIEVIPYLLALWFGLKVGGIQGAAWAWTFRVTLDASLLFLATFHSWLELTPLAPGALLVLLAFLGSLKQAPALGILLCGAALLVGWLTAPACLKKFIAFGKYSNQAGGAGSH